MDEYKWEPRSLVPTNESQRREGDWIVCAYCGVRMWNESGLCTFRHAEDCKTRATSEVAATVSGDINGK